MRITGGAARSIPLRTGKDISARPATDRMREAVFSSLGRRVEGARFLDLFAGTGAYGLEAWSRGAAGGVFVEKNRGMLGILRENIAAVERSLGNSPGAVEAVGADVLKWRPTGGALAEILFVDPPYEMIEKSAGTLFERFEGWLTPGGIVVFEMPGEIELEPEGWTCGRRLGKGRNQPTCCFFERSGE